VNLQTRLNERRRVSAPIILELQTRWEHELQRISGKSKRKHALWAAGTLLSNAYVVLVI